MIALTAIAVAQLSHCAPVTHTSTPPAAARCDSEWSAPGSVGGGATDAVEAIAVFDDGAGPALYVGGRFGFAGGLATSGIVRWDGRTWTDVGGGFGGRFPGIWPTVSALAIFDDGRGPALYAGGDFTTAGGAAASCIARWDGASWTPVGGGITAPIVPSVEAFAVFDDGSGPALYAGGSFFTAGAATAINLARWDGVSWTPVGEPFSGPVRDLLVFDDGSGPALYAAGDFSTIGDTRVEKVARWDGVSWTPLGSGIELGVVHDIEGFDDGSGPAIYAGGHFAGAGGVEAQGIARWDGEAWSDVAGGVAGSSSEVRAMAVFDDGAGPALYVGGAFTSAGGAPASLVARWNGAWSALDGGLRPGTVESFAAFHDGSGSPALYVGGHFERAGDVFAFNLARWGCSPCPADCDASGELTFFDFLCFQNLFSAGDPGADCDEDTSLTFFDFLCFQTAYAAGCP